MRRLSPQQRDWLQTELQVWTSSAVITDEQAGAIRNLYESDRSAADRRAGRVFQAVMALAVLMCSAGVLLLIGYNWPGFSRTQKVAIVFGVVGSAFAASVVAYVKARPQAGETLALAATLLYGNAIWLLAQVFHIQGRYPDGVLWWIIGAAVTAHLLASKMIGLEAALLVPLWLSLEWNFPGENLRFVPLGAAIVWLAYRVNSPLILRIVIASATMWLLAKSNRLWLAPALAVLLGTAAHQTSRLPAPPRLQRAWASTGMLILLLALVPFGFTDMHDVSRDIRSSDTLAFATAAATLLIAYIAFLTLKRAQHDAWSDIAAVTPAAACALWLFAALSSDAGRDALGRGDQAVAIAFSVLIVGLAVWLITRGATHNDGRAFFAGVSYGLLFVVVRVISLIGNLLLSAVLLLAAGGVLLFAAKYWKDRRASRAAEVSSV